MPSTATQRSEAARAEGLETESSVTLAQEVGTTARPDYSVELAGEFQKAFSGDAHIDPALENHSRYHRENVATRAATAVSGIELAQVESSVQGNGKLAEQVAVEGRTIGQASELMAAQAARMLGPDASAWNTALAAHAAAMRASGTLATRSNEISQLEQSPQPTAKQSPMTNPLTNAEANQERASTANPTSQRNENLLSQAVKDAIANTTTDELKNTSQNVNGAMLANPLGIRQSILQGIRDAASISQQIEQPVAKAEPLANRQSNDVNLSASKEANRSASANPVLQAAQKSDVTTEMSIVDKLQAALSTQRKEREEAFAMENLRAEQRRANMKVVDTELDGEPANKIADKNKRMRPIRSPEEEEELTNEIRRQLRGEEERSAMRKPA